MSELPEEWLRAYVTMEAKYGAEAVLDTDKAQEAADELAKLRAENERSLEYFGKMHETLAYVRAENERLREELREYTALRYAGDCKCGGCQLVPRKLIDRLLAALAALKQD